MYMHIDETWNDQTIVNPDHRGVLLRNGNNTALVHRQIHILKMPVQEDGPAGQQYAHVNPLSVCSQHLTILNRPGDVNGNFFHPVSYTHL